MVVKRRRLVDARAIRRQCVLDVLMIPALSLRSAKIVGRAIYISSKFLLLAKWP